MEVSIVKMLKYLHFQVQKLNEDLILLEFVKGAFSCQMNGKKTSSLTSALPIMSMAWSSNRATSQTRPSWQWNNFWVFSSSYLRWWRTVSPCCQWGQKIWQFRRHRWDLWKPSHLCLRRSQNPSGSLLAVSQSHRLCHLDWRMEKGPENIANSMAYFFEEL